MLLTDDGGMAGAGVRRAAAGRRDGSMQPTQYRLLFMFPQMSFVYEKGSQNFVTYHLFTKIPVTDI